MNQFFKNNFILIVVSSIFILSISCSGTHKIPTNAISFTGHIYDKEKQNFNLKYKLSYDSVNAVQVKLYDVSGIKLIDVVISADSFKVKYILSDSYKEQVYNFYTHLNREICVYNLIVDLFQEKMFDKSVNPICYSKVIDVENWVTISSLKYNQLLKLEGLKFKNFSGFKLASEMYLFINNKQYIFTIEK